MFSLCSATYAKAICIALDAQVAKMDLAAPALGPNLTKLNLHTFNTVNRL